MNVTDPDLCVSVLRYQEELPTLISSRPDKHVTQSELVKLMEWKLTVSNVSILPRKFNTPTQKMSRQTASVNTPPNI